MATDHGILPPASEPDGEGHTAPLVGSRAQTVQRLQVGLFGLAAMVLLVGLANIINSNREQNEAQVVPEAAATTIAEKSAPAVTDPLADAGVVPEAPAGADASQP